MKHTIKQTMFVHAEKDYNLNGNKFKLGLKICDMSEYGYVLLDTVEVSVDYDLPEDFNFTQCEIDLLKKKKKSVQAEAQKTITRIDEQIQRLQCIEYKGV